LVLVSAANANDATMFEAVVDDIPPIRLPSGRRRRRPCKVHADKAHDHHRCRAYLRRRGIRPRIRYERDSERFYALVLLACSVTCFNTLQQATQRGSVACVG
jgi:Transposase DDE domain